MSPSALAVARAVWTFNTQSRTMAFSATSGSLQSRLHGRLAHGELIDAAPVSANTLTRLNCIPNPKAIVIAGVMAVLLTGCGALHSDYTRPDITVPAQWQGTTPTTAAAVAEDAWWRHFGDSRLHALVADALRTNNDLAAAGF